MARARQRSHSVGLQVISGLAAMLHELAPSLLVAVASAVAATNQEGAQKLSSTLESTSLLRKAVDALVSSQCRDVVLRIAQIIATSPAAAAALGGASSHSDFR